MTARTFVCSIGFLAALGVSSAAKAHLYYYHADLTPEQVVPATTSDAFGTADMVFNHHTYLFSINVKIWNIDPGELSGFGPNGTPLHIRVGSPGEEGPIAVDLGWYDSLSVVGDHLELNLFEVPFGGIMGDVEADVFENEVAIYAERMYIEVYTKEFPEGDIRGQFYEVPAPGAVALLPISSVALLRRRRR